MLNTFYTNIKNDPLHVGAIIGAWLLVAVAFGAPITQDQLAAIAGALVVTLGSFQVKKMNNDKQSLKEENVALKASAVNNATLH